MYPQQRPSNRPSSSSLAPTDAHDLSSDPNKCRLRITFLNKISSRNVKNAEKSLLTLNMTILYVNHPQLILIYTHKVIFRIAF